MRPRKTRARAQRLLDERSVDVDTLDELVAASPDRPVFAAAPFCNLAECEAGSRGRCTRQRCATSGPIAAATERPCLVCGRLPTTSP